MNDTRPRPAALKSLPGAGESVFLPSMPPRERGFLLKIAPQPLRGFVPSFVSAHVAPPSS